MQNIWEEYTCLGVYTYETNLYIIYNMIAWIGCLPICTKLNELSQFIKLVAPSLDNDSSIPVNCVAMFK